MPVLAALLLGVAAAAGPADGPRCCTVTAASGQALAVDCGPGVVSEVAFASFGVASHGACGAFGDGGGDPCVATAPVRAAVAAACVNATQCEVAVTPAALGADPCPDRAAEYVLSAEWTCSPPIDDRAKRALPYTPPFHTVGAQIVDATGVRVDLRGVNWYGAHGGDFVTNGLDRRGVDEVAGLIADLGFNVVRLQFSSEMVALDPVIDPARLGANPQLQGLRALDVYEAVIEALHRAGVFVILDNHISTAGWCCGQDDGEGLWYTEAYPEAAWLDMWDLVVRRFGGHPNVIAAELRNEIRATDTTRPTWGTGDPLTDWARAATLGGEVVLRANPELLVMVIGLDYGTDLRGVHEHPITLSVEGRLVYVAHSYSYFAAPGIPYDALRAKLDREYGFVVDAPIATPLFLSEFGDCHAESCTGADAWIHKIVRYIGERGLAWAWWPIDGTMMDPGSFSGSEWGREEIYGLLDMCWGRLAYPPQYASLEPLLG